jgi:hypothetical protein
MAIHPWLEKHEVEEEQKRRLLDVWVGKSMAGVLSVGRGRSA